MEPVSDEYSFCTHCGKGSNHNAPAHHLLPGTLLQNRYQIGAALGEGGFGITYIGRDINLDMIVAVKEYFPNGYVSRSNKISATIDQPTTTDRKEFFEKGCEKFLQEARVLAKFSSEPGIVNVRDFFEQNNTAYIVMEYLKGETLKEHLKRRKKLEPNETLGILMPVMASLKKVHADGLIHRDISPDNIMLVAGGAKLLDFGAARDISAMGNKSLSIMLKPGYAPAEQYRTHGEQGPWTDVYALCATIYKCITGITPDDSIDRNFSDTLKAPSALGIAIAPAVETALLYGLTVDHRNRYQNIDELIDGFKGVPPKSSRGGDGTIVIPKGTLNSTPVGNKAFHAPDTLYPPKPNSTPAPNGFRNAGNLNAQPPQRPAKPQPRPVQPQPQPKPAQPQGNLGYNNPPRPVQPIQPIRPVTPAPVAANSMLNRVAFSVPPTAANYNGANIWLPLIYIVLSVIFTFYNTNTFAVLFLVAGAICSIFSAVALQVKTVPILAKIARWLDFGLLALMPLVAIFAPEEIWEYSSYISSDIEWVISIFLFIGQFCLTFASVATYYKRTIKQGFALTSLNSTTITGALAAILFITLGSAFYLPIIMHYYDFSILQFIGFLLVWSVPTLSLLLPEKRIPNAIWIILKIFSIIAVVIFGYIAFEAIFRMLTSEDITGLSDLSYLTECYYELEFSDSDYYTYIPNIIMCILPLVIEFLYFAAMIFNIDIAHTNIYRKKK